MRCEGGRREVHDLFDVDLGPGRGSHFGTGCADLGVHLGQRFVVDVAQVGSELHAARNHVARAREHVDRADRAATVRRVAQRDGYGLLHQPGSGLQRVAAQRHRRRAGVRLLAGHRDVVPALAERTGHGADHDGGVFQHRALFDVRFEIRREERCAGRDGGCRVACVADGLERGLDADALAVDRSQRGGEREGAGIHARAHHHGHEARAFLVGPDRHLEREARLDVVVVQRAEHFQHSQHTVVAVELAAGRLRVDVAARGHRRCVVLATETAREDVADLVDANGAAGLTSPADDLVAALPVQVGEGHATDAAGRCGADGGQFHQAGPEAVAVDR